MEDLPQDTTYGSPALNRLQSNNIGADWGATCAKYEVGGQLSLSLEEAA